MYRDVPSGSAVKNPPAVQETWELWVRSLGWEDPWRRKWTPTPVFLPEQEEPRGLQYMGLQRVRYDLVTKQQQQRHLMGVLLLLLLSRFSRA